MAILVPNGVRRPRSTRPRAVPLASLVAGVLVLVSCGGGSDPAAPLGECRGNVTMQVASGPVPRFEWAPACRLDELVVEDVESGERIWHLRTEGRNGLTPGVSYGVAPPGAVVVVPPAPLEHTGRYTGAVFTYLPVYGTIATGTLVFTP